MLLHSPALQKLRPNLQHRRWDPRCAGDAGLPRSAPARRLPAVPQAPRGATSRGPAFLTERHRSPGYVVPPPAGSCWRLGTQAQPGLTAASCVASPSRNAGPAAPFLAGDPGRRGPRRKGPRGSVPGATGSRALPTCLPLRRRPTSRPRLLPGSAGFSGSQPAPATLGAPSGRDGAASPGIGGRSS